MYIHKKRLGDFSPNHLLLLINWYLRFLPLLIRKSLCNLLLSCILRFAYRFDRISKIINRYTISIPILSASISLDISQFTLLCLANFSTCENLVICLIPCSNLSTFATIVWIHLVCLSTMSALAWCIISNLANSSSVQGIALERQPPVPMTFSLYLSSHCW